MICKVENYIFIENIDLKKTSKQLLQFLHKWLQELEILVHIFLYT